jgi:cellulose synthase/poly-beta-1,6-N-acetylglucosamine synthase-like glycosyltransferase
MPLAIFVASVCLGIYPFVIYPSYLWIRTRRLSAHARCESLPLPSFSVIIPCHNEERVIQRKVANTLTCAENTKSKFRVIVVSDASTDRTCDIARQFGSQIHLIELKQHSGILGAFRAGLEIADGEAVIFSDADVVLAPDTFSLLLSHYADPQVGGVCGFTSMHVQSGSGLNAEQLHIGLRAFILERQSILHSTSCADGSNWSVRRHLITLPSEKIIADDLVIPLEVVHRGYRYIFEKDAAALETSGPSIEHEFRRRIRTIAGGMQAAMFCRWMFSYAHRRVGFHFVSSKLAKHATIIWAAVAAVCAIILSRHSVLFALIAMLIYVVAAAVVFCGAVRAVVKDRTPAPINTVWHLFLAMFAPILALRYVVKQGRTGTWEMTPRADMPESMNVTDASRSK